MYTLRAMDVRNMKTSELRNTQLRGKSGGLRVIRVIRRITRVIDN
jgi:hypothetical protein